MIYEELDDILNDFLEGRVSHNETRERLQAFFYHEYYNKWELAHLAAKLYAADRSSGQLGFTLAESLERAKALIEKC